MAAVRLWRGAHISVERCVSTYIRRQLCVSSIRLSNKEGGKLTHTGQQWNEKDYRNVRFIDREKQVNEQFAIDLVAEEPVVTTNSSHIWCDGGNEALGHPKVYINLDKPEINICGYCGKRFVATQHKHLFPNEQFEEYTNIN